MNGRVLDIKRKIEPVLRRNGVIKAAMFGSYVRGEATKDSDVDILVELPEEASLIEHAGLKIDLEEILQRRVDVVTRRAVLPEMLPYIQRDLVMIYGE